MLSANNMNLLENVMAKAFHDAIAEHSIEKVNESFILQDPKNNSILVTRYTANSNEIRNSKARGACFIILEYVLPNK